MASACAPSSWILASKPSVSVLYRPGQRMRCTVEDNRRVQSKQGWRVDYAYDAIRGIDEVNNVTILLSRARRQPHPAANL
jgi:hypothetical protein